MLLSALTPAAFLLVQWIAATAAAADQTCSSFVSDKLCSTRATNLVDELTNIPSPARCQEECRASDSCKFFTWVRFVGSLESPPACYLFRNCDSPDDCGPDCDYSITGPVEPAYPTICCKEFYSGQGCDIHPDNLLELQPGIADQDSCQQLCQALDSCAFFVYDVDPLRCFLLRDCDEMTACSNCWSGPQYPTMSSCPGQAAVLLGGNPNTTKVQSWPCDISIPDLVQKYSALHTFGLGAAVLGDKVYVCGGHDDTGTITSACFILEDGTWKNGPSMVETRAWFTLNSVGDVLVAAGGYRANDSQSDPPIVAVEILREGAAGWQRANWSLSSPRGAHCAVTYSDKEILIAGGVDNDIHNPNYLYAVEKYNLETGEGATLAQLNRPGQGVACTLSDNFLIVSGGSSQNVTFPDVEKLDLSTFTWSMMPPMNINRRHHTIGVIDGVLAVFGGTSARDTMETFNGAAWETKPLAITRSSHAMIQLTCPAV